jgi:hypothetical protein
MIRPGAAGHIAALPLGLAGAIVVMVALGGFGGPWPTLRAQSATTISGRISQPDGTPAAGAMVFAAVIGRDGRLRRVAETVSEWDGQYHLAGVGQGQYVIGARRVTTMASAAVAATYYPSVAIADARHAIAVFDGVPVEGIDIWLHPLPQRYSVSGRIHWPDGGPVENLAIEYGGPSNPRKGIWYVFDPGGLFNIEGVPPGTMVMLARADSAAGPLVGMASTDVSVAPVEDVRIVLDRPGSIDGRVVFQRPLPSGTSPHVVLVHRLLRVSPLYPIESGSVDPDGRFRVPSARGVYTFAVEGLPDGWRVTRALRNGRVIGAGGVTVGPAQALTGVELTVGPGAR